MKHLILKETTILISTLRKTVSKKKKRNRNAKQMSSQEAKALHADQADF